MKKFNVTALVIIVACAILQCVNGPAAVEEEQHVPEKAVPVTVSDFDARIAASRVALVEFFSEKCPVCASLAWAIDSLHAVFSDRAFVGVNNTDSDTLYKRFSLSVVPAYIFFKDGKEAARRSFIKNDPSVYDTLAAILGRLLADTIPFDYLTLDESAFDSTVLRKGTTAMVFFQCAGGDSCISMDSVVRQLVPRFEGRAIVARVRAWENTALCGRYGISDVPQFLFFKDSVHREELRLTGVVEGDTLATMLERLLAETPPPDYLTLDESTFDSTVLRKGTTAMVLFLYPFCLPCSYMDSVVRELVPRFEERAVVARVYTTNTFTLCERYGISDVPQILFFKDSVHREELRLTGVVEGDTLATMLERLLAETPPPDYLTLDESTFDSTVLRRGTTAMVFFLYAFGSPCIYMDSVIRQFAPQFEGRAIVAKVHAWENMALCDRYGISGVPLFLFFKDSVYRGDLRRDGIVEGDTLAAMLERLLADTLPDRVVMLDKGNFGDSVNIEGRVAMVDFFLPTCSACQGMNETVSTLADSFYGTALIAKVDCSLDDSLDEAFGVQLVPTFVFLKGGVEYYRCTGVFSFDELSAYIREGLGGAGAKKTAAYVTPLQLPYKLFGGQKRMALP
jgi:thioredoxin 1